MNTGSNNDFVISMTFNDEDLDFFESSNALALFPAQPKPSNILFQLVCNQRWNSARIRARDFPKEAHFSDRYGTTCLHVALRLTPPCQDKKHLLEQMAAIEEIVRAWPQAWLKQDSRGWTPVHVAVHASAPETLSLATKTTIDAAFEIKNVQGMTPIELFCESVKETVECFLNSKQYMPMGYLEEIWQKLDFLLLQGDKDIQRLLVKAATWSECPEYIFHFILLRSMNLGILSTNDLDEIIRQCLMCQPADQAKRRFYSLTRDGHDISSPDSASSEGTGACHHPQDLSLQKAKLLIGIFPELALGHEKDGTWLLERAARYFGTSSSQVYRDFIVLVLKACPTAFGASQTITMNTKIEMLCLVSDHRFDDLRFQLICEFPQSLVGK